ncbi:septum formation initiator [Desulfomonile tiedjei]|uniref:Septum formation initiator n=1 Tax=Desulfomonile tiedjei (strain ATCC 49306 / DSM 6799 / DCB-1) TaxID=706587 RepID=I4CCN1_DESTA|nr:septum formation initiator [Desulfomonile tiedjei]AFM27322.1 Septum formation initiator [Desulfomonile tiedjei DSM 6799]
MKRPQAKGLFSRLFSSVFLRNALDNSGIRRASPAMVMALSVAILFVGLFYVWTRMQLVQIGYQISSAENKNNDLKKRKRELLLEIASLQSPRELENKASKIGLVFPSVGKVIHVP